MTILLSSLAMARIRDAECALESARQDAMSEVFQFVREEATRRGLSLALFVEKADRLGKIIHLPVCLDAPEMDIWERVEALQTVEDAWNDQQPSPPLHLILRPSKEK